MSCTQCKKVVSRCDCCWLVDGDSTYKEVVYCKTCNAYICKECETNWEKRVKAYFLKKVQHIKQYFNSNMF